MSHQHRSDKGKKYHASKEQKEPNNHEATMVATKLPCSLQSFPPNILLITLVIILLLGGGENYLPRAASFVLPSAPSKSPSAHPNKMLMSSTSQSSATEAVAPTTLGPTALRTLVQNASIESQHCLDLNGIVWLEHLNLVVGDMDLALKFYVDFLGLSRDSNPKHVNLGQQQVR